MRGPAVRTVFFGSGAFAVPILDAVSGSDAIQLVGVVSAPDRPTGRSQELTPTPVARRARDLGLPLLQPERIRAPDGADAVRALQPDLGVLADYGQIVPRGVLDIPRFGILNVHPSALPRHRGATPIQGTIAAGDPQAGVTIMLMDEGLDTGSIVAQATWPLDLTERAPTLEAEAARRGADLLMRTLEPWLDGTITPVDQDPAAATATRPLRRADGRLDWSRPARELERQVRAYLPWPGSFVETAEGRLAVIAASAAETAAGDVPGEITRHDDRPALVTVNGRLVFDEVQLAGRRAMDGRDFLRGHPSIVGSRAEPAP
jgi:methionyl-tRNA formyltransferase